MAKFSFIDFGIKDFLRNDNDQVIIIDVTDYMAAEDWLLKNGEDYGWTNTGVQYLDWDDES